MTQVPCKNIVVIGAGGLRYPRGFLVLVYSFLPQVLSVCPQQLGSKKKEIMRLLLSPKCSQQTQNASNIAATGQ